MKKQRATVESQNIQVVKGFMRDQNEGLCE